MCQLRCVRCRTGPPLMSVAPPAVKLILRGTITMRRPVSTTLAASPRLPGTRPEEFGNTRAVSESTGFVT